MKKNKFAEYGKLSVGGEEYALGKERHLDLLREAEESRMQIPTPRPASSGKNRPNLKLLQQLFAHLF